MEISFSDIEIPFGNNTHYQKIRRLNVYVFSSALSQKPNEWFFVGLHFLRKMNIYAIKRLQSHLHVAQKRDV